MKKYIWIGIAVLVFVLVAVLDVQCRRIRALSSERDRYKTNTEILASESAQYKVNDSLNAARIASLTFTIREFEKFRAEDAALIQSLKSKNRDLQSVVKNQTAQIYELSASVRDTVVLVRDSIVVPAQSVRCGDEWYSFEGILSEGNFSGKMETRDDILVAETVRYKRFLGFLWKTKKIKDRRIDVVSRNPHSKITDVEHVRFVED